MNRGIFLLQGSDRLLEMREQPYDSEDLLQRFLATHPALLAGDQIRPGEPRRWLLITREASLPSEDGGSGRWSVDHLFLDQDAVPTLVEVKRSSDTRIRREVVGQMLDYAANAVVYWPVEALRRQFEVSCSARGISAEEELATFLGGADTGAFWQQVKTNLQAGRVRLLFVADEIPAELRRIVEFLNQQMDPAEVLAVEIKQYVGEGLRTLVPTVVGQTAEAQQRKGSLPEERRQWDEATFFEEMQSVRGGAEALLAQRLLEWIRPRVTRVWWGKGRRAGSFVPVFGHGGIDHQLFAVWTSGSIEIYFQWYQLKPPFDAEAKRLEMLERLNQIPGVVLAQDAITRRPNVPLSVFTTEQSFRQLQDIFMWYMEEVRSEVPLSVPA